MLADRGARAETVVEVLGQAMSDEPESATEKLLGTRKLRKGVGRLLLDALGHLAIGFGCGLIAGALAPLGVGRGVAAGVGAGLGLLAGSMREGIQWAKTGSPHLLDRALDIVPAPLGGAIGGVLGWVAVSNFLR